AAEEKLHRLGCLEETDDARQDAEDARLRAARREMRRRRLGVEAAGTRSRCDAELLRRLFGGEDRELAVEAEDRSVDDRLAEEHARVIDEVARREVVGAVDDDIVVAEDPIDVLARETLLDADDLHVGVEVLEDLLRALDLRHADAARRVEDLTLQ